MRVRGFVRFPLVALLLAALMAVAAVGCGGADPTPTPRAATPTPADPGATPDPFQAEWDALIAAAQQEGRLVAALGAPANVQFQPIFDEFSRKFNIDVTISRGSGNEIANRILAERSANRYEVDIIMAGITTMNRVLLPAGVFGRVEDLFVHPEVLDKSAWFNGRYYWNDPEEQYVFAYGSSATLTPVTIYYNTSRVSQEDLDSLQSAWDLLDPRWHGVMATIAPSEGGSQGSWNTTYFHPDMGPEWIERLFIEADLQLIYDRSSALDRFIQGHYHLILGGGMSAEIEQARDQGLPVREFPLEREWVEAPTLGFSGASRNLAVADPAANPNAQKLFVNWFLSREGQTAMHELVTEGDAPYTLREDVTSVGNTRPIDQRDPNRQYLIIDGDPEVTARLQESIQFALDLERRKTGR